ncbi:helix-turn-helix domain-containing protein [Paenibacillus sp. 5J-6]|uniref:Helix-turn-helix domain-containing protein n=1 Tax=Paenibacillus silvestris TaxID=2606219 RepID=A0A6L8USC5_9BACL|nr:IclR family transcriptional regulator [Paenibacillus silvestris]MZQ80965.1 helix-turn-helix domain-containing protein [Paenibacillus silvestris]
MATESKGHGIQSVELGLGILKKISEARKPLTATEISNLCDISKSKLHKYLTSFTRAGFLQKNQDLKYLLGTELILLGLKASEQLDIQDICLPYITKLREMLNETVALAIWGESGPFFIRWEQSNRAINLGIKTGSRVSVTESAPGRLFSAYLPKEKTQSLILNELKTNQIDDLLLKELNEVKRKGFALTSGTLVPGITAVSCPVFDLNGSILAALTVVSMNDVLDISEHSDFIINLKQIALELSQALGFKP